MVNWKQFERSLVISAMAVSISGCIGTFDVGPRSSWPAPVRDEAENRHSAERVMCSAERGFLEATEGKLRTWNTTLSVSTGVLAVASGGSGVGAAATSDAGARTGFAAAGVAAAVLAIAAAGVRLYAYTDDHGYVRAKAHEVDVALTAGPAGNADSVCGAVMGDQKLPQPDAGELRDARRQLDSVYSSPAP
jgi:hypothetical protein